MKKNDYAKSFKKPKNWKKADAVLFLAKYKFSNGKLNLVAVPYRKVTEAAKSFKNEVKKAATYTAKLTLLGTLDKIQGDDGNITYKITPLQGAMNLDFLQTYGKDLFQKLKVGFEVVGATTMEMDDLETVTEAAGETLSNKKSEKITKKQAGRANKADKVAAKLSQFEKAIGKVAPAQLQEKALAYEQVLADMQTEAQADGTVTAEEQQQLDNLTQKVSTLKILIEKVEAATVVATNIKSITDRFPNN